MNGDLSKSLSHLEGNQSVTHSRDRFLSHSQSYKQFLGVGLCFFLENMNFQHKKDQEEGNKGLSFLTINSIIKRWRVCVYEIETRRGGKGPPHRHKQPSQAGEPQTGQALKTKWKPSLLSGV